MTTTLETAAKPQLLLTRRAGRIADELERAAVDGWLIYDFRGSNPAFGRLLASASHSTRRAFLFIPRQGEPKLLMHHVDAGNFARLGIDVQPFSGREDMLERLRELLGSARRVLMEYSPGNAIPYVSRVDAGTLELVRSLGIDIVSSADALASVVAAWDAADVQSHQRAAQALERSKDGLFSAIHSRLALGATWTEYDAQQHLVSLMEAEGLEFDHPPIVAVGPHAGDPHYAPTPELALPIESGALVLVDLWAREKQRPDGGLGAYADITWMATAADRPSDEHLAVFDIVRSARDAVTHRTGHSLGWHGAHGDGVNIDDFETHDTRLLRPGAAFSIEPGIYVRDFGVRSEINVVITPGGQVRVTTPPQRALVPLTLSGSV